MKSSVSYAVMSSICALIVGLLLILWPDVAVNYLVITIGVLFLLPGIYGLFSYFAQAKKRERANLHVSFPVIALGSTLLGLWLVIMPEFFVSILMYVLGVLLVLGAESDLELCFCPQVYAGTSGSIYCADFGTDYRYCCADESFSGSNGSFYRIGRFVDGLCPV